MSLSSQHVDQQILVCAAMARATGDRALLAPAQGRKKRQAPVHISHAAQMQGGKAGPPLWGKQHGHRQEGQPAVLLAIHILEGMRT